MAVGVIQYIRIGVGCGLPAPTMGLVKVGIRGILVGRRDVPHDDRGIRLR